LNHRFVWLCANATWFIILHIYYYSVVCSNLLGIKLQNFI